MLRTGIFQKEFSYIRFIHLMQNSVLFEGIKIGSMELRNRFMRSATTSAWSDEDGVIRPEIIELYRKLSEGGVGLIVKGHLYVAKHGKVHIGMAGIDSDRQTPMLKRLTDAVHEHGGKIVAQLNHGGLKSMIDPAGPSEYYGEGWRGRELSSDEIWGIIEAFGEAAERAIEAGFDGVQIHGAHGYLISEFLSPLLNKRGDGWGGSLENRMRLLIEVYTTIRKRLGKRVPILLKMNCDDFVPSGFGIEDSAKTAATLCRHGVDAIEISGGGLGLPGDHEHMNELKVLARSLDPTLEEASYAGYATRIREVTKPTPMALVNGIRSRFCMESILRKDIADLVSMSRPFIREPDLVKRLQSGQGKSTCTSCGLCESQAFFSKTMLRCHGP